MPPTPVLERNDAGLAIERFTDDARQEGCHSRAGFARPNRDGRKAQGEAVDQATSGVVVDECLAYQFLAAIGHLGRGVVGLCDAGLCYRSTIYCFARCVDDFNSRAGCPQFIQQ